MKEIKLDRLSTFRGIGRCAIASTPKNPQATFLRREKYSMGRMYTMERHRVIAQRPAHDPDQWPGKTVVIDPKVKF